jgi:hypothetical protein
MKKIIILIVIGLVLICGCSQPVPTVETIPTTVVTESIVVIETPNYTVGPTPTPTNDISRCYWHNTTEYPDYCYDRLYWVRPTYSPPGMGYTAKVWRNSGCANLNRTSGMCEEWGNDLFTVIFLHNQTIVKNITSVENTELIAAVTYYNRSFDLNTVNDVLSFDQFINTYWDKTYPSTNYNASLFIPDETNVIIPVVNGTFNPDAYNYSYINPTTLPTTKTTPSTYIIITSVSGNGEIYPSGDVVVGYGYNKTLYFTPSKGYKITKLIIDGVNTTIGDNYTFENINSDHDIHVIFS